MKSGLVHTNLLGELLHCLAPILTQLGCDSLDCFWSAGGPRPATSLFILGHGPSTAELLVPFPDSCFGQGPISKHFLQPPPALDWGVVRLAQKFHNCPLLHTALICRQSTHGEHNKKTSKAKFRILRTIVALRTYCHHRQILRDPLWDRSHTCTG